MARLLTPHIATMTELREPHKVIARAGGKPVAILKNSAVIAYFIPIEFVENGGDPFKTMDAVIGALKSAGNTPWAAPEARWRTAILLIGCV